MKKILYGIAFYVISTSLVFSQSSRPTIDLILPAENTELDYIAKKLSENKLFFVKTYVNALPVEKQRGNILIVVSDKLLPLLDNNLYPAKFGFYVNSIKFNEIKKENISALYSDQPLHRQLLLISEIYKKNIILGIPYFNEEYKDLLKKEEKYFEKIEFKYIKIDRNNVRSVNKVIQNSDVLLATPEKTIYNQQSIRGILLSSYRHQTPLIGPNEGFVTAGALASVITSSDQYIEEMMSMVIEYIETKSLPRPRHPSEFLVRINTTVAESLGIEIQNENQLEIKMRMIE